MKLTVLGCDGGRGLGYNNTSLLFNETVLIDAGTIQSALTIDQALKITDIFLTHAHLDHLVDLPFLLDATFAKRKNPLRIHALPATLDVLMTHIFNDAIWPNFSVLPTAEKGQFSLHPLTEDHPVTAGGLTFTPFAAPHTIPTVGFVVDDGSAQLIFSGDSGPSQRFIDRVQQVQNPKAVIVDLSFPVSEQKIAELSGHMTADDVAGMIENIPLGCDLYMFHAKVGLADTLADELAARTDRPFKMLRDITTVMLS